MNGIDYKSIIEEINRLTEEDIERYAKHYLIKDKKEARDSYFGRSHNTEKIDFGNVLLEHNRDTDLYEVESEFDILGIQMKNCDGTYRSWFDILDEISKEFKKCIK